MGLKLVPIELCTDNAAMIGSAARFSERGRLPRISGVRRDGDLLKARRVMHGAGGKTAATGGRPVVRLYGRPGCHLCDEARSDLERMRSEGAGFDLEEVDIDSDDGLLRSHLERIPVIEIAGEEVCELGLEADAVRAKLATLVR